MSQQVWTRRTEPKDTEDYIKFAIDTPNNLVDPDIFTYPHVVTFTAHTSSYNTVFMPMQLTATLESLAINPEAKPLEVAESLRQLIKTAAYEAQSRGVRELYFVCKDEATAQYASRYFEELPYRTFRLKLNSLEAPQNEDVDSHPDNV